MPFVFAVIGVLFLVIAVRGTQGEFLALMKSEFVGSNSFLPWAIAIIILAAIGYIRPVRPVADAMIGLIFLAMILGNKGGFFSKFNSAISGAGTSANPASLEGGSVAPIVGTGGTSATGNGGSTVPTYQFSISPGSPAQ